MSNSLSDYLLRDFVVERASARLFTLGSAGGVRFPPSPRAYFHFVLAGNARIALDEVKALTELRPGDSALLLYGAGHRLCRMRPTPLLHTCEHWSDADAPAVLSLGSGTSELRVLSASVQLTRALRSAPVNRALPHLLHSAPGSAPLCEPGTLEAALRGRGAMALVAPLVQLHLTQMLRQTADEIGEVFALNYAAVDLGRLAGVVRRMRAHPEQRSTVASLAREAGWSRSTFAAKFQAYAGVGPMTYAAQTRLAQAEALLKANPTVPLWEVARRVGYDVQGSFTRAFKSKYGVSPRQFVARLQAGEPSRY